MTPYSRAEAIVDNIIDHMIDGSKGNEPPRITGCQISKSPYELKDLIRNAICQAEAEAAKKALTEAGINDLYAELHRRQQADDAYIPCICGGFVNKSLEYGRYCYECSRIRDEFITAALQALVATDNSTFYEIAVKACKYADAALQERARTRLHDQ